MDISVVILTWNSEKYIRKCMESLLEDLAEESLEYEIYIVDNGSKDSTLNILNMFKSRLPDSIECIVLSKNTGTTYSRNLALKRSRGRSIVVMDSDVEVVKGAIGRLVQMAENINSVGIVAPKIIYPSGALQKSTDRFPTMFTKMFRFLFLKHMEKRENMLCESEKPRDVDYAISAMWLLKSEVLEKVGLLDENIFYSPEDVDYCLRVWKAGYRVLYDPNATAIHHAQEISRGVKIGRATVSHIRGLLYYFFKHKCFVKRPRVRSRI
jgi:GT2 family glycosyltransferase